ncbi:DUF1015 domain-containing protein [Acidobacteria bacterium AH-259-G07]|nr:DUF1015 domain-containing protein [Acidobacteria bacterium AH-259-G07]
MVQLFPFHGYRYNPDKIEQLADVLTQPYDKISADMWRDYLRRHPYNIVRVIKNRNYQEAGQYLKQWIQTGVLKKDASTSFYPYEQTFEIEGQTLSRLGFIGLVSLEDAASAVKGHEKILHEPLQDRLNLIRSTESSEGLVFMLYSDSSRQIEQLLSEFKQNQEPIIQVVDDYQVSHRLWQLSERGHHAQIVEALKSTPLYIADGHHRFQTSLRYFQECTEKGWRTAAVESFDKRIIALFNMQSPGLKILPTHRAIRNLTHFQLAEFLSKLEPYFEVESVVGPPELDLAMQESGVCIGLVAQDNHFYLLRLREKMGNDPSFMPQISGPAKRVDVNVLHEGILSPFLGIGAKELANQEYVDYFRDRNEPIQHLRRGHYQLVFLLNPTTLEQVREISEAGEEMPQKSTDFYPKLLTGLVLMKMEIDKS